VLLIIESMISKFEVEGLPAPQGSKRYVGNNRFVEASKYLPAWRSAIENQCRELFDEPLDGALEVELWFYLPKPSSVSRVYPSVMPDTDKLVRAVGDGLTKGGAIADDSRIVNLLAYKRYSLNGWTGVHIQITTLDE
jgi:Holliday junction resolvase RusA-like endonuclease